MMPSSSARTTGVRTSKTPVPLDPGFPRTMLELGLLRSSKSPWRVASERKAAVVSNEALRSGDDFDEIPVRLKGLYPPSCVCAEKSGRGE